MGRLLFACLLISISLTSCTVLPGNFVDITPPNITTNLLVSDEDLTHFNWMTAGISVTSIEQQSDVLYPPPAPSYTYPLTSRLIVTAGSDTPSIHQIIAGSKQNHSYRMTAIFQGYDDNTSVMIRFADLDNVTYPNAEKVVAVGKGVQRVTFEFTLPEDVSSFIFSMGPQLETDQFIDIGELKLWDSTPNLVTDMGQPGCQVYPSHHFWNVPIDDWLVHPDSGAYLRGLRAGEDKTDKGYTVRLAFGARSYRNSPVGTPINMVDNAATEPNVFRVKLKFVSFGDPNYPPASPFNDFHDPAFRAETVAYPWESDDVIYPMPTDMFVQGLPQTGVIDTRINQGYPTNASGYPDPTIDPDVNKDWLGVVLEEGNTSQDCDLYELYKITKIEGITPEDGNWRASSAAHWHLNSNIIEGYRGSEFLTSASASGLPLMPGLVRYEEAASGEIRHALGMITSAACDMVWPARHIANTGSGQCVPLGMRLRLKPNFLNSSKHIGCNMNSFSHEARPIITALQKYGAVIVDSGISLFVIGTHDSRWGPPVDIFDNPIGGSNTERNYDISNEVDLNNCWPKVEDFEVVDTDRYAHWRFARDFQENVIQSQIYTVYNNRPVYDSMGVYGE